MSSREKENKEFEVTMQCGSEVKVFTFPTKQHAKSFMGWVESNLNVKEEVNE